MIEKYKLKTRCRMVSNVIYRGKHTIAAVTLSNPATLNNVITQLRHVKCWCLVLFRAVLVTMIAKNNNNPKRAVSIPKLNHKCK